MEILDEIIDMLNAGEFNKVTAKIGEFLNQNPGYKKIDYYHFSNPLEELLFNENIKDIFSVKTLELDEPLEEIYTIYSIAHMNLGNMDEAEKYLKIANQINPVSAPILMRLCELYQQKHEEEKLIDLTFDIFKYAYERELIVSNYFKLADYLYHTNQNMELYDHLFNFFMFLRAGEGQHPAGEDVEYFKKHDIPVGVNPEILSMLLYLADYHTKENMPNSARYFKEIYRELYDFNKYLDNL
ncbi:MAG: hypothetical protein IJ122_00420 [Methanobrevibacter sp.]|nr:hypothetical protein [Methanobrevibacter sp.]